MNFKPFSILPRITFIPLHCRWMPESIKWLVSRGKIEEAKKTVIRISKINKIENPPLHLIQKSIEASIFSILRLNQVTILFFLERKRG